LLLHVYQLVAVSTTICRSLPFPPTISFLSFDYEHRHLMFSSFALGTDAGGSYHNNMVIDDDMIVIHPRGPSHDTLAPAHGPADGLANAPTIVDPPRPKIRAPAPPLVAPPAHMMMRAKSANPKPHWMQQPSAPYTSLRPFLTHAAALEAPPPHRLPPSGPPSSLRPPLIRIRTPWALSIAAALAHSGLPPQVAADSPSPVENTVVSTTASSSRPSIVAGRAVPPQVAAHSPAQVEGTDVSTPELWIEIWESCWALNKDIARKPGCRSDFDNAMMMFQQLAEYEWGRPPRVRNSYPVTVDEHQLARWRSPSPRSSRSPSHATSRGLEGYRSSSHSRSRSPSTIRA